jgi:N-methylhydantoinase A
MTTQRAPANGAAGAAVAVDIGGTFTDIVLFDRNRARLVNAKVPTTPADPSLAFVEGIAQALTQSGLAPADIGQVFHGTTVATNLILEGKGAPAALLTTAGFKHVLEIGRHDVPRKANLFTWVKPKRPVPPQRIFEIAGRLDSSGAELTPLDEAVVRAAAQRIKALGIRAVAVCFLHSYADPAHERRARDLILAEHPEALVSLSSEVLPILREYERSMVTILNAYVMPAVSSYVARLEERLGEKGIAAPLLLMKSGGGVTGTEAIRREPVQTALSGPAAGVLGAMFVAQATGFPNLISIDIGGTSADICLVKGSEPAITIEGKVGGWPMPLPMIDIHTIGAGGGSIAAIAPSGGLTVGPRSAGAVPGPAAYGRGGTEPTVTDAHLVLGHLPPHLLDGRVKLDRAAAAAAIRDKVATPLGLSVPEAARGILNVIDNNMVGAIRVVSVERGHDPRDFALVPFGGAGPMHGGALARLLGIKTIVVPPAPGVLSALGLLVSDLKSDYFRTCLQRPPHHDLATIERVFAEMERDAAAWLDREGTPPAGRDIARQASLRYIQQGFELTVPWPGHETSEGSLAQCLANFHRLHERLYTFAQEDTPAEIVTLRVTAIGRLPNPSLPRLAAGVPVEAALIGRQTIESADGTAQCPVYDRTKLGAEATLRGPAIVQQLDATTLILPGQEATVHPFGSLVIREVG